RRERLRRGPGGGRTAGPGHLQRAHPVAGPGHPGTQPRRAALVRRRRGDGDRSPHRGRASTGLAAVETTIRRAPSGVPDRSGARRAVAERVTSSENLGKSLTRTVTTRGATEAD